MHREIVDSPEVDVTIEWNSHGAHSASPRFAEFAQQYFRPAVSPVSPEAALNAIAQLDEDCEEDGADNLLTHPSSARDDHPTQFHIAHPVA